MSDLQRQQKPIGDDTSMSRFGIITIPESPAPLGYLPNPYQDGNDETHARFLRLLDGDFADIRSENGVDIHIQKRSEDLSKVPTYKGSTFIAHFRPVEIFACIHLFSYRLLWDTRLSSGRILQRYGSHSFLYYAVYRGIGKIYKPRDSVGVQDARCWGPDGKLQRCAYPDTQRIDMVFRSVETPEVPLQEGKVRMHVYIGGFRIEWNEELQGCHVSFVGDADIKQHIPTYVYNGLAKEMPTTVGRLRSSVELFGVPPYLLDEEDCVVIQMTFFYPQSRVTTLRHHVCKPGKYSIVVDTERMYRYGLEIPPEIEGEGAPYVEMEVRNNRVLVSVRPDGVGKEYLITLRPMDVEEQPVSMNEWW